VTWFFDPLDRKAYGAIVADPPWNFRSRVEQPGNWRRSAKAHYSVMTKDEITALPIKDLAGKDCHLFLWATGPHLPDAFEAIRAWGFKYSGVAFTWVKLKRSHNPLQLRVLPTAEGDLHVGLGLTTRKNAEFCLLARRGSCRRAARNVREIIMSPVREHSRKPEEFRNRVEAYVGPGIRIAELFARSTRPGWDCWGDQLERFAA
jgi:N6-adenosine-specific RNA methylase IME4